MNDFIELHERSSGKPIIVREKQLIACVKVILCIRTR